eukprot:evm.model.scf_535.6 EVM.evm.TU.scf_535.6   scf_535:44271-50781(-)
MRRKGAIDGAPAVDGSVAEEGGQGGGPASPGSLGYFEGAPSDALMGMFSSLMVEDRLDAALEVLRRLVQANRLDVLGRVRHKDFLRRAADRKAVKLAFRFLQVLPREFVDARTYNMLVTVCVRASNLAAALKAADMMKSTGLKLDVYLYTNLIKACSVAGDVNTAFDLYAELKSAGIRPDCQVHSVLTSTCAQAMKNPQLERREQLVLLERAVHLLEDMKNSNLKPDTANWNTLMGCAAQAGQLPRAFEMLQSMEESGCIPDAFTYSVLIDACSKANDKDAALKVYKRALKEGVEPTVVLFTSAVQACTLEGDVNLETVLGIYSDLGQHGVKPDSHFYAALIRAAGMARNLDLAFSLREDMKTDHIEASTPICSALIGAALFNSKLGLADSVYQDFASRKIFPCKRQFNVLLTAHARRSGLRKVIEVMKDFVAVPLEPDVYTYTAILSACQRVDEAELAYEIAQDMKRHGIPWDEGICFTMLRICYNRLWAIRHQGTNSSHVHLHPPSPEAWKLLETLGIQSPEVPKSQVSSDSCWVDRAVSIYKDTLSSSYTPTIKVLDRLFACLRIPRSRLPEDALTPFRMTAHNLREVQQLHLRQTSNDGNALSGASESNIFDPRAIRIAKEAISKRALPQFYLDRVCELDLRGMPPAVAEVYVLTLFESLKDCYGAAPQPHEHPISFHLPPYDMKDVFSSSYRKVECPDEAGADIEDMPEAEELDNDVSIGGPGVECTARSSTSLIVVATLQRLGIWYHSDADKGRVWVDPKDLTRWAQAHHRAAWTSSTPSFMGDRGPMGMSIASQRRSIRLGTIGQ